MDHDSPSGLRSVRDVARENKLTGDFPDDRNSAAVPARPISVTWLMPEKVSNTLLLILPEE